MEETYRIKEIPSCGYCEWLLHPELCIVTNTSIKIFAMPKPLFLIALIAIVIASSCSSVPDKPTLPNAPASVKAVQDEVKGKKYKVEKAGTHSVFANDKEIEWLEPKKDTSNQLNKFENQIVDDAKSLSLHFVNDTSVTVTIKDKTFNGTYIVNDTTKEDEKPGIKLRISYVDEEFKMGDGPASIVTYTYIVEGISDKSLLLGTPRSMNDKKIVVLMSKQ